MHAVATGWSLFTVAFFPTKTGDMAVRPAGEPKVVSLRFQSSNEANGNSDSTYTTAAAL